MIEKNFLDVINDIYKNSIINDERLRPVTTSNKLGLLVGSTGWETGQKEETQVRAFILLASFLLEHRFTPSSTQGHSYYRAALS